MYILRTFVGRCEKLSEWEAGRAVSNSQLATTRQSNLDKCSLEPELPAGLRVVAVQQAAALVEIVRAAGAPLAPQLVPAEILCVYKR